MQAQNSNKGNQKKCEIGKNNSHDEHTHGHTHGHTEETSGIFKIFFPSIISFTLLIIAICLDSVFHPNWFTGILRFFWYGCAYFPVGFPIIRDAYLSIRKGEVFSEFTLMTIATLGAFAIGEYPEGVAVMLFYSIGEVFQTLAVKRANSNIKTLLDQRPDEVTVVKDNISKTVKAENVRIDDIIQLKPGEKLALDGELISETGSFNTAALTGESKPETKRKGDLVLAGMVNLNTVVLIQVKAVFKDTKLSKILDLIQNATKQKAPTELFIRKFAKIYTPIVVFLAVSICLLPYFFVEQYVFSEWLYRALIFLVISCPCALVISIPLGYFGGIGAGSKNGILFKGSNFLDAIATVQNVVLDKTGTLTEGVFEVQEVNFKLDEKKDEILQIINVLESKSAHPIAKAINKYVGTINPDIVIDKAEEIPGYGLKAEFKGKELLVGNFKLLDKFLVNYDVNLQNNIHTVIAVAYDKKYLGYLTIADRIKEDALKAIDQLNSLGIKTTMLSGDKSEVVEFVANQLKIKSAYGDLLPEDKVEKVKGFKSNGESVAFVGDGFNDAPVIAISDIGIAMGGLGSDATIETADIVIQDDKPSKIPMAVIIGKETKKIIWQNIFMAFSVKILVLILGAGGLATMWEAVFADVGVALLAILNAVRIQKMKF